MRGADRLLLRALGRLLPRQNREWMLGDIEEEYVRAVAERGRVRASVLLLIEMLGALATLCRSLKPFLKGRHVMGNSLHDVRYAVRLLARSPGFTLVAAITLALGIGANTALFSVVHGVLVKPLPYPAPDALVRVFEEFPPETPEFPVSPATFLEWRRQANAFEWLAAYERGDLQLEGDRAEQLRGMRVTAGFFELLGYQPTLGRVFGRADEAPSASGVVILSHALWTRRFAADRSVIGRTLTLSGRSFEIVGVLPPGVQHVGGAYRSYPHGHSVDIWWPRTLPTSVTARERQQHYLNVIGRMRPGITPAQAHDDVRRISSWLAEHEPATNRGWSSHVRPLRAEIVGEAGTPLIALFGAAGATLLIACLNVGGLLLGRATARTREISVRAALGATRTRVLRQLIIESALLASLGGILGTAVAYVALQALLAIAPPDTPRLHMIGLDRIVLGYAIGATLATALIFGLAPAFQLARTNAWGALHGSRGASAGRSQQRVRRFAVVSEIAVAFVLVAAGALLLRSFAAIVGQDPGFRSERVLTASVNLPPARYPGSARAAQFFEALLERVRALPGVESAGFSSDLPWTGYDENTGFGIAGRQFPDGRNPDARYHFLTPGFVTSIGLPVLAGRDLSSRDRAGAPAVVLINEATAREFWGDPSRAVGARLDLWGQQRTVVGVIGAVPDMPWDDGLPGGVYFPQAQNWYSQEMLLAIRVDGDPLTLVEPLRRVVRELDPALPLGSIRTLDDISGAAVAGRRFTLILVGAFAAAALFLSVVGVYGVMAQAVNQREREFGVRQALGASPAEILRLVVGGAARLGIVGIVAGLALALPITRAMGSLLFRTPPSDPLTLASVAVLLAGATIAAAYIPARRATRADPAATLRQQ